MKHYTLHFLIMVFLLSCKEQTSTLFFSPQIGSGYFVPIEINGHQLNFLWDTGADQSMIPKRITDSLSISISEKTTRLNVFVLNKIITTKYSEKVNVKIGDQQQSIQFALDTFNIIPDEFDGIMGMDIIGKFTWLFDHKKGTIAVSNKKQDVPIDSNKEESLILKLGSTPYLDIIIPLNDTIQERILFDTGSYGDYVFIDQNRYLGCGLKMIANSIKDDKSVVLMDNYLRSYWKKEFSVEPFVNGKSQKWYIAGKQNLNGVEIEKSIINIDYNPAYNHFFPKKLHVKSLEQIQATVMATYFFVRRFDRFYFSYKERKLILIKSKDQKDDTTLFLEQVLREAKLSN